MTSKLSEQTFPKELYQSPNVILDNIDEIWQQQTVADFNNGRCWYEKANTFSLLLANKYKVDPMLSAAVISVLSPLKEWTHNMELADEFLKTKGRVCRHYLTQKRKARYIYNSFEGSMKWIDDILVGPKTINFFHNIYEPNNLQYLCIDRHMINVALGQPKKEITDKQYNFLKEQFIKFADQERMIPNQLQGILWLTYKRVKKI